VGLREAWQKTKRKLKRGRNGLGEGGLPKLGDRFSWTQIAPLKIRRFELNLSEIDFERIERLLGLNGAASMGEVIRDAVRECEAKILSEKKKNN